MNATESGFVGTEDIIPESDRGFTDIEILRTSQVNIIARARRHGRLWLLKGLAEELRYSTSGLKRLHKEFEIHSRLCNPAIVQAVNLEDVDGFGTCIIMEWVEGDTLSTLLDRGVLSSRQRRSILQQIVTAVAYIHRNGIVHRDLKPANIMLRRAGRQVVIIDFGLADTDSYAELKQAAGTRGFISPEQLQTGGASTADDVYSLGIIIRELCPGNRRLANICTRKRADRPADALQLLKLMQHSKRRRRILTYTLLLTAAVLMIVFALQRIAALEAVTHKSASKINELSEENNRKARDMTLLADSLHNVNQRMHTAENALSATTIELNAATEELNATKAYARLYETLIKEGRSGIDEFLIRKDKTIFSRFEYSKMSASDYSDFWLKLTKVENDYQGWKSNFGRDASRAGLKEPEVQRMKEELDNYFIQVVPKYHEKWKKRIYPEKSTKE